MRFGSELCAKVVNTSVKIVKWLKAQGTYVDYCTPGACAHQRRGCVGGDAAPRDAVHFPAMAVLGTSRSFCCLGGSTARDQRWKAPQEGSRLQCEQLLSYARMGATVSGTCSHCLALGMPSCEYSSEA